MPETVDFWLFLCGIQKSTFATRKLWQDARRRLAEKLAKGFLSLRTVVGYGLKEGGMISQPIEIETTLIVPVKCQV